MGDNIIRFPGFIVTGRHGCLKDGVAHPTFRAMVRTLSARPRADLSLAH